MQYDYLQVILAVHLHLDSQENPVSQLGQVDQEYRLHTFCLCHLLGYSLVCLHSLDFPMYNRPTKVRKSIIYDVIASDQQLESNTEQFVFMAILSIWFLILKYMLIVANSNNNTKAVAIEGTIVAIS